jgi:hypothetical protein
MIGRRTGRQSPKTDAFKDYVAAYDQAAGLELAFGLAELEHRVIIGV